MRKDEVIEHLKDDNTELLFREADHLREKYCGEKVLIRGIIEFSNHCVRDCLYCGLRKSNTRLERYRMSVDEILDIVGKITGDGVGTVVLQSGDDPGCAKEMICGVIREIKKRYPDVAITLSIGERPFEDYRAFREYGADRYLIKHETINPRLYERLHPGQTLGKRIEILESLKKLGYQVGAGNIVGLPGQTLDDLADDILFLEEFQPDMAGIGPFIPQKDTSLKHYLSGDLDLTLKVLALVRIVTKNAHLPATTALATVAPKDGQFLGLRSGANVIMPDCTPSVYGDNYNIYDGRARVGMKKARDVILKAGRTVSTERGDTLK